MQNRVASQHNEAAHKTALPVKIALLRPFVVICLSRPTRGRARQMNRGNLAAIRSLSKLRVHRVFGLFWLLFDSNRGGNILDVDIALAI